MAGRWDEEDWSLALAEQGCTEHGMEDVNAGAPVSVREERKKLLEERRSNVLSAASKRTDMTLEDIKEKNKQALLERKKKLDAALPEGWRRVESRSRPGEYVYENIHTEERQAWLPTEPALKPAPVPQAPAASKASEDLRAKNAAALEARKKALENLPEGWRKVESNSRPGQFVFENIYTEERIAWLPTEPARKQALPEQALKPKINAEKAKALYEYCAASSEEMDLAVDDIVLVEHKAPNGWWVGTNARTGKLGLFPGSFVEIASS